MANTGIDEKLNFLKSYAGRPLRIMEICGSHTAAISKSGLRQLLSPKIELISGPGCPVCVTPTSYIDRLIGLAEEKDTVVCVFGDMLRVPGSSESLSEAKGRGAKVEMLFSPLDMIRLAKKEPEKTFVFAAVGFETTTPAYALLLSEAEEEKLENIKILTALKTMPQAVSLLCEENEKIDGFLAPGHVCAVRGYSEYAELAGKYQRGFTVSGFEPEELVEALYELVNRLGESEKTEGFAINCYEKAVSYEGNKRAEALVNKYFESADAAWRGIGVIKNSGLVLKKEYEKFDMGSRELYEDNVRFKACRCGEVICGKIRPDECPLFEKACTPFAPKGACMVSAEGACRAYYDNT